MTVKEMDKMTRVMRDHGSRVETRIDLENYVYYLKFGLRAIGRDDLADELDDLYDEMENVDTDELIEIGTFI